MCYRSCEGCMTIRLSCFFFQAEDGIRDKLVTGVQTCALPTYVEEAGVGPAPAAGVGDAGDDAPRLDAWTALALLAGEVRSARIGAVLDAAAWPATRLARMAATLGALTGGRFELTLRGSAASAAEAVRAFREALAATTVPAALAPPAEPAAAGPAVLLAAGGDAG